MKPLQLWIILWRDLANWLWEAPDGISDRPTVWEAEHANGHKGRLVILRRIEVNPDSANRSLSTLYLVSSLMKAISDGSCGAWPPLTTPTPPPTIKAALSSSLTTSMKTSVTELSTWGSTRYPLIWRLHTICNLIGLFFHLNCQIGKGFPDAVHHAKVGGAATVLYLHIIQNFYNLSKPVSVWILFTE